ncbi:MAG TPA: hypothetical protein QKA08_02620 [Candidatus Megaira endosymbiont of Nemacystus decipiens]|nr:hypothetical protein [Candidatus Megaera endosymbiont of Nemacystus decipiens]
MTIDIPNNDPHKSMPTAALQKGSTPWYLKKLCRSKENSMRLMIKNRQLCKELIDLKKKIEVKSSEYPDQILIRKEYHGKISYAEVEDRMNALRQMQGFEDIDWFDCKTMLPRPDTIGSSFFPEGADPFKYYQKREGLEDKIDDLLKENQCLVISGPPGQGKSTFTSYYIKSKSRNEGCLVRYISASSENDIIASFKRIAALYEIEGVEDEYLTGIVLKKLSYQGNYSITDVILFFDNVESYDDIVPYLPSSSQNIKVIITSRNPMILDEKCVFKLPPFNKKESLEYLKENLPSKFRGTDQLEKLLAEVGDKYGNTMPYAMDRIATWFKVKRFEATIDGCIEYIRTSNATGEEDPETKMLLDFLNKSENHAESWKLLQYASYLEPDFIDPLILAKLLDLSKVRDLNKLINPLFKLSLIDKVITDSGHHGITVHEIIQKAIKNYITKHKDNPKVPTLTREEIQEKLIQTLNEVMPTFDSLPEKWDEAAEVYKQVEKLLKEVDFDNLPFEDETVLKELSSLREKARNYNLYVTNKDESENIFPGIEYTPHDPVSTIGKVPGDDPSKDESNVTVIGDTGD